MLYKKDLFEIIKVSASLEIRENMVMIVIKSIGKPFIVQRIPFPVSKR
jgi:hypothetical protein